VKGKGIAMSEPSERNMEKAESIFPCYCGATRPPDGGHYDNCPRRFAPDVAQALHDAERPLLEALRELCRYRRKDGDCWCETPESHSPGCKAARKIFALRERGVEVDDAE
jgi:hypothetical protein